MVKKSYGKIVFTASILSFQGGLLVPSYAASKGGIAQLTKSLSNELAEKGINVNSVAPGYIETDITTALRHDPDRSKQLMDRIPQKRWGKVKILEQQYFTWFLTPRPMLRRVAYS